MLVILFLISNKSIRNFSIKKNSWLKKPLKMFGNINDINAYKSFQKVRVILFILILVVPFSYFLLYIDLFVTKLIFNIQNISMLRHLFDFSWWRIAYFLLSNMSCSQSLDQFTTIWER